MPGPFDDFEIPVPAAKAPEVEVQQKDNWVSFTFPSAAGHDRIAATVHGEPEFVAKVFAVENFDGKISTLMKQAVKIDEFFKKQYGGGQGKA